MKPGYYIEENELLEKAIKVLMEKLGPLETFRFLAHPQKKRMESVKRHRQWQAQLDQSKFIDEVFSQQN
jgi:hypothetical protein